MLSLLLGVADIPVSYEMILSNGRKLRKLECSGLLQLRDANVYSSRGASAKKHMASWSNNWGIYDTEVVIEIPLVFALVELQSIPPGGGL